MKGFSSEEEVVEEEAEELEKPEKAEEEERVEAALESRLLSRMELVR